MLESRVGKRTLSLGISVAGLMASGDQEVDRGLLLPVHGWRATSMFAIIHQNLSNNRSRPFARAERILLYLGTHGVTILLLTALLLGVILLD